LRTAQPDVDARVLQRGRGDASVGRAGERGLAEARRGCQRDHGVGTPGGRELADDLQVAVEPGGGEAAELRRVEALRLALDGETARSAAVVARTAGELAGAGAGMQPGDVDRVAGDGGGEREPRLSCARSPSSCWPVALSTALKRPDSCVGTSAVCSRARSSCARSSRQLPKAGLRQRNARRSARLCRGPLPPRARRAPAYRLDGAMVSGAAERRRAGVAIDGLQRAGDAASAASAAGERAGDRRVRQAGVERGEVEVLHVDRRRRQQAVGERRDARVRRRRWP
jgi:hypothetical protein